MRGIPSTFGKDPSFVVLVEVLNEHADKKFWLKVSRCLQGFRSRVKSLRSIENPRHHEEMLRLLRDRVLSEVQEMGLPNNVFTHLNTCLTTIYREEIRQVVPETVEWNKARREQSREASTRA